ncbi:hypothetical protein, partial [Paenibacillus xylanexedens]|uniref:hypothetical protein n=1 Tax=Paenibacillus xylanexedens TaxID=528191 RepID=UPI001C92D06B
MLVFIVGGLVNQRFMLNGMNVVWEWEGEEVGMEWVNERRSVFRGGGVGLVDGELLAFVFQPMGGKGFVIL